MVRRILALATSVVLGAALVAPTAALSAVTYPAPVPAYSDAQLISASTTPPTEAQCESVGRTCFTPRRSSPPTTSARCMQVAGLARA
jgi:hypothetical protein